MIHETFAFSIAVHFRKGKTSSNCREKNAATCQSEAFAGTSTISPAWSCKTSSTKYHKRRTGIAGDAGLPSILGQHSSDKIDKLVVLLAFTVDRRFGSLERIFHIPSLGFSSLSLNYTTVLHRSQIKDEQSVTMKL